MYKAASKQDSKIVMVGCHRVGEPIFRGLVKAGFRIDYFVSISPEMAEKNKVFGYFDYSLLAREFEVPIYLVKSFSLTDSEDQRFFADQKFDLLVQGGWMRIFPEAILKTLRVGAIGGHGSSDFLPKGRGRSPLNWSIVEGKKRFLLHQFIIQPGIDDGDVFDVEDFDILDTDDIETLYLKNSLVTTRMLIRNIPKLLSGSIEFKSQHGDASHYPKRGEEDSRIDFENMDIWTIERLIRAVTRPYGGAWGKFDGRIIRIWKARVFDTRITFRDASYGDLVAQFDHRLIINCRGGLLLVEDYEIQETR